MTKANDLASLLDANGDVVSSALDNVPPSNDASALSTGTLPDGRFPAVLPAVSGANLTNLPASNDASALTTGTLAAARLPSSGVDAASLTTGSLDIARIAANAIGADKLVVGKYIKQMKHVRRDSAFTSTSNDAIAMSLTFDNAVTIGNQILIFASGAIVSGTASANWGSGGDLFLDSTRLTSNRWTNGDTYGAFGAVDLNGDGTGGSNFGIMGIGTAGGTNPTVSFKTHLNSGWTWTGINYSFTTYGHTSSNLVAIEFGT